jgi:hypothetical protein
MPCSSIDVNATSAMPPPTATTWGGAFDRASRHYRNNIIVYAARPA